MFLGYISFLIFLHLMLKGWESIIHHKKSYYQKIKHIPEIQRMNQRHFAFLLSHLVSLHKSLEYCEGVSTVWYPLQFALSFCPNLYGFISFFSWASKQSIHPLVSSAFLQAGRSVLLPLRVEDKEQRPFRIQPWIELSKRSSLNC